MVVPVEQSMFQGLSREDTLQALLAAITTLSTAFMNSSTGEVQREIRNVTAKDTTLQQVVGGLVPVARDASVQAIVPAVAAVAAKLSSDPATQAGLTGILNKMPQAPALDATVSSLHADLAAILAKLPAVPAVSSMWRYSKILAVGSNAVQAAVPGVRHGLTAMQFTNASGLLSGVLSATLTITVYDDTNVLWQDVFGAGAKAVVDFPNEMPLLGTAGKPLSITASGAGMVANLQGYDA